MDLKTTLTLDEGRVAWAYPDSEGYLTIGIGHLIDKRKGGRLPEPIIDALFDWDVAQATQDLEQAFPWFSNLNEARKEALINMRFQLGLNGLAKFKLTLAAIRDERWAVAAEQMRQSLWARQTRARCLRLARQIETGERQ